MIAPLASAVGYLNQPMVKASIKKVSGVVTFAFGIYEVYRLCVDPPFYVEEVRTWKQTMYKAVVVAARISIVLSAAGTQPGVYLIGTLVGVLFTPVQLERVFGPNTLFAINPYHPRHVVSIVALILAMPAMMMTLREAMDWTRTKIEGPMGVRMKMQISFNFITNRAVLHQANMIFQTRFS